MRRATLRDLPALVYVVGVAFTRPRGGVSRRRDRVARGLSTWISEVLAVLCREAYINADGDVVVHLGRRRAWWTIPMLFGASAIILVVMLVLFFSVPLLVGAAFWFAGAPVTGLGVGAAIGTVLLITLVCLPLLRTENGKLAKSQNAGGPTMCQAAYRRGAPRPYWLINTLASSNGRPVVAIPLVRSWLPERASSGDTVVAVARNDDLRRLYAGLKFEPLPGSTWVLFQVIP